MESKGNDFAYPSAPSSDSYYPQLPAEELPPPYSAAIGGPGVSENDAYLNAPRGTPQGHSSPQGTNVQKVLPPPPQPQNQQQKSSSVVVTPASLTSPVVILESPIPPGVCHICKKGKIKDSATCCSWLTCLILLPFGILPGLIAFCYLCRKPKCTRCGFIHGRGK